MMLVQVCILADLVKILVPFTFALVHASLAKHANSTTLRKAREGAELALSCPQLEALVLAPPPTSASRASTSQPHPCVTLEGLVRSRARSS
mmetsp:Transcript_20596/g.26688  ORF Transcript_20596/g.26688 Transcript_20596/m.26688 type:complete len:91 (+) Transcript_20596:365-637(+)